MTTSKQLAQLIGPSIVVLTTSEILNFHIWEKNIPPVTYLNGLLLFVAGLAIVRVHNRWSPSWPVLVTLVGWTLLLGGSFRMFAPEAQQSTPTTPAFVVIALLGLVGPFLTLQGYRRGDG